ncbi:MAG TPA: PilZ domain-containing protein [Thiolapillus brandeum]|uniref:PilZ domain-containing protein n=1 Tax=Thiolapillus brandeum TaxID=1076588 RepID=A0A831KBR9_9GAMM|nr:PilZ domain-containing protein [Thiolapillus brandeum]
MDRRISPRVEWNGPIRYRTEENGKFHIGFLADISTNGAMLWLPKPLNLEDHLEVVMKSEYDPKPVHMHMRVKRIIDEERQGYHGYGCALQTHEPWEK